MHRKFHANPPCVQIRLYIRNCTHITILCQYIMPKFYISVTQYTLKAPSLACIAHTLHAIREIYKPFYETTATHKWIGYCYHVGVIVYTCFHGKGTV